MAGTVYHIVLFDLIDDVKPGKITEVTEAFHECGKVIDGIISVSVSHNISKSKYAKNWTFSVIMTMRDTSVLETLLSHPSHQKISDATSSDFQNKLIVFDHLEDGAPYTPMEFYDMPYGREG